MQQVINIIMCEYSSLEAWRDSHEASKAHCFQLTLFWTLSLQPVYLQSGKTTIFYLAPPEKSHQAISDYFSIKRGLTDTSALSGNWKFDAVSHNSRDKNIPKTFQATLMSNKNRFSYGRRRKRRKGKGGKRYTDQHVKHWKMNKRETQQHEPRGSYGSRSLASPQWQITQNTHNERQEYGSSSLFPPNCQTPYWLSSGREEVIWFLSPFGKLIHFTKVTW